jgi:hypothetical protein
MADAGRRARAETGVDRYPVDRKDLAMTDSPRLTAVSPLRSRRRLTAIALLSLTLAGGLSSAAYAGPDTNIQKPGHISVSEQ